MVRIHDARMIDVPGVVECLRIMHRESGTHSKYRFLPDHVDFVLRSILDKPDPSRHFLKAASDDATHEVVGFIGAEVVDDIWTRSKVASAHAIYIQPEYRGLLAFDLVSTFTTWARRNADRIELQVTSGIRVEGVGRFMEALGLEPRGAVYGMEF